MKPTTGFRKLVERAEAEIESLTPQEVDSRINKAGVLVVDLRDVRELKREGKIPGAEHVPRGMLEFWADPSSHYGRDFFEENKRTSVFCAGGGRSVYAVKALQDMGFTNVAHLAHGFGGWQGAGEPIEDYAATSRWVRRDQEYT